MSKVTFNLITMKDGKIHVEEKKELSKTLSEVIAPPTVEETTPTTEETTPTIEEAPPTVEKMDPWYFLEGPNNKRNEANDSNTFFSANLFLMEEMITDEAKKWKINHRISQGFTYGTFRRYKTKEPMLVKHYKTRRGAEQNTFWRNH